MNKKTVRIISIILIALFLIICATPAFAAVDPSKITGEGNVGDEDIARVGNNLATIIRNIGIVAAIIILMVIGIKYMMGSAEEKAEYKKVMIPYLVGAVLLFSASVIVPVLMNLKL